jgi:hypothetical protein
MEYVRSLNPTAGMTGESVAHSSGALLFLLVATVLSVYKPRGMTRYGWRKQREERQGIVAADASNDLAQESEHEREGNEVHAATFKEERRAQKL